MAVFVENAYSFGSGGFAGDPSRMIENNQNAIAGVLPTFQRDADMQDISEALAASETPHYDFGAPFGLQLPTD